MKRRKPDPLVFINNRGKVMHIPGHLTLAQLTEMGVIIKVVPHGTPLPKGEWRSTLTPDFSL